MKTTQQSFVKQVKPDTVDTGKKRGSPAADCRKIKDLLLSYKTISCWHNGMLDEIMRATVRSGRCAVLLGISGKTVDLIEVNIVEDFGFE